jgi:hypothetical protein
MSFPRFAGGKFISNCLSLSQHCCPQDTYTATHLLNNSKDYNLRLQQVLKTIPATKKEMIHWIPKYEFGDIQLYGSACEHWSNGISAAPTVLVQQLIDDNFKLFLNAHGGEFNVKNLLKVWPNSCVIKLINHSKFSEISRRLKSNDKKTINDHAGNYCKQKFQELAGETWPTWEQFESVGYNIRKLSEYSNVADEIEQFYNWDCIDQNSVLFDVDGSIFNKDTFLQAMEQLYLTLGLDDFNPNLVATFWQTYISLHIDN